MWDRYKCSYLTRRLACCFHKNFYTTLIGYCEGRRVNKIFRSTVPELELRLCENSSDIFVGLG